MKRNLLWLLLLLIAPIASAELTIEPNPFNIEVTANQEETFELSIKNNFSFKIMDFQFSNLTGFNFPEIEIEANETETIQFTVLRSEVGEFDYPSIVSFKYLVEIPEEPTTYYVNITNTGFDPDFIVVRAGDTIIWKNSDEISHSVTGATFNEPLQPNETFSMTFEDIGIIEYMDTVIFWAGTIEVIGASSEEKVNNPAYNTQLEINLDVTLDPTSLEVTNNKGNYTITYTGSEEGLLEITNNGDIIAQRIFLKSDPEWIIFDENNFDLNLGETNFVTYRIEPIILQTENTNKTYNLNLTIKASNTDEISKIISVFIPYDDISGSATTDEGFIALYDRFCSQNANSLLCNNTISTGGGETIIEIRDPAIPINLTTKQVLTLFGRIQRIEDSNSRTNNELKDVLNILADQIPAITNLLNKSIVLQEKNEEKLKTSSRVIWWLGFFILIIICILIVGLNYKKFNFKKGLQDGGLTPKTY